MTDKNVSEVWIFFQLSISVILPEHAFKKVPKNVVQNYGTVQV